MYHIQTKPDCHNPSWSGLWQGLVMYHIQTKPDCHNPSWSGLWQETSKESIKMSLLLWIY
jgi:hypothetical protein